MISTLALFPLPSIVFPSERLPLHVSEPRYLKLIQDCVSSGDTFGIPIMMNNQLDLGTEATVEEVVEQYSSGSADIILKGLRVFKLLDVVPEQEGEPFPKGRVQILPDIQDGTSEQRKQLVDLIRELYLHLEISPPNLDADLITSFTLSHKIGLAQDQEYILLKIRSEKERLAFLINHLTMTIPVVQEMNRTKMIIEMNGHFRDFNPLDFEDYKM